MTLTSSSHLHPIIPFSTQPAPMTPTVGGCPSAAGGLPSPTGGRATCDNPLPNRRAMSLSRSSRTLIGIRRHDLPRRVVCPQQEKWRTIYVTKRKIKVAFHSLDRAMANRRHEKLSPPREVIIQPCYVKSAYFFLLPDPIRLGSCGRSRSHTAHFAPPKNSRRFKPRDPSRLAAQCHRSRYATPTCIARLGALHPLAPARARRSFCSANLGNGSGIGCSHNPRSNAPYVASPSTPWPRRHVPALLGIAPPSAPPLPSQPW